MFLNKSELMRIVHTYHHIEVIKFAFTTSHLIRNSTDLKQQQKTTKYIENGKVAK